MGAKLPVPGSSSPNVNHWNGVQRFIKGKSARVSPFLFQAISDEYLVSSAYIGGILRRVRPIIAMSAGLISCLVGFFPMYPLIGFAKWADPLFHVLDNRKGETFLAVTRAAADRTKFAQTGQCAVHGGCCRIAHFCNPLPIENALPSSGPTPWYPLWAVS